MFGFIRKKIGSYLLEKRNGMFFPLVILAGIIIVGLAYAFHQYRVAQIAMTDEIARFYAATCVAEAGISCVIAELRAGGGWKTHQTKLSGDDVLWDAAAPAHTNLIQPAGTLTAFTGTNGTAAGKLGILGDFKVRCGPISAQDNADTKSMNESSMYFLVESIGKYLDTYVKVSSIVESRNLSEFLIYDGEFLDMVLGLPAGGIMPDASNFFSIGTLYGKKYVYLGTIKGDGSPPLLKMDNMSDITTGTTGEIYIFDPYVTINNKQMGRDANSSKTGFSPAQGTGAKQVSGGAWNTNFMPNNVGAFKDAKGNWNGGVLKDGRHGGRDLPIVNSVTFKKMYKTKAQNGGIYIASPGGNFGVANTGPYELKNPYSGADLTNLRYIDFGAGISDDAKADTAGGRLNLQFFAGMERETNITDPAILAKLKDPNFNGYIYSEVPLRLRGNPPKDTVIACDKDIYICGDFNQTTDVFQNYTKIDFLEYKPNVATGLNYWTEDAVYRTTNPTLKKGLYRHRVTIFSDAKVWYDYTRPDFVFENELKPYMEWLFSAAIARGADAAGKVAPADMTDVYKNTNVVKFKLSAGKVSLATIGDYDLAGKAGSILDMIKTNNSRWADVNAFCADPACAGFLKFLDNEFFKPGAAGTMDAKQFIIDTKTNKLQYKDPTATPVAFVPKDFLDILKINPGSLNVAARRAVIDGIFKYMSENGSKSFVNDPQPGHASSTSPTPCTSMPWKLFEQVGLTAGGGPNGTPKPLCEFNPAPNDYDKDRLFLPELTINARVISSDARLSSSIWDIGNTTNAIYNELGNRNRMTDCNYGDYMPAISSIFRLMGSEIFLREKNVPPTMAGSVYKPCLRKKIYDAGLTAFEDPQGITNYGLATWVLKKSTKAEYDAY